MPHLSALIAGSALPPPPVAVDYTAGMGADYGMMLNDQLGDCTCAAYYHARQVWSFDGAGTEITEPDSDALKMYEESCGYSPSDPSTDQGGVEQDVLAYLLNTGAPIGADGGGREKLIAYVEVDPRNLDDVKRVIADCGGVYIGFNVPDTLMADDTVPAVWSDTSSRTIVGGHAVFLPGYDIDGLVVISWGQLYRMTWGFFAAYTEEAYALLDPAWVRNTGMTPAGMSIADAEAAMQALRS